MHSPATTGVSFLVLLGAVGGAFAYISTNPVDTDIFKEPWFGFQGSPLSPALAEASGLEGEQGFLVMLVQDGSPAAAAGLRGGDRSAVVEGRQVLLGGDLITGIDGQVVTGAGEIEDVLASSKVGDRVELTVLREGLSQRITVTLGEAPG